MSGVIAEYDPEKDDGYVVETPSEVEDYYGPGPTAIAWQIDSWHASHDAAIAEGQSLRSMGRKCRVRTIGNPSS